MPAELSQLMLRPMQTAKDQLDCILSILNQEELIWILLYQKNLRC
jgi:hypothetical protein